LGAQQQLPKWEIVKTFPVGLGEKQLGYSDPGDYPLLSYSVDENAFVIADLHNKRFLVLDDAFDIKETILETGGPVQVSYEASEQAILDVVPGSYEDFTALYLVDIYDQFATIDTLYSYLPLDSRVNNYYEEEYNSLNASNSASIT